MPTVDLNLLTTIRLTHRGTTPLFRQLYTHLKNAILEGRAKPAARLPPTRVLAQALGISRQTVLAAYEQLTAEGYLQGTVGRGTFVSEALPATPLPPSLASEVPLLHPLSPRGSAIASAMARVGSHVGPLRAFRVSMPGLDLFPFDVWRRLEARHWRRSQEQLGYADAAGHLPLRELLCAYLQASRGVRCTPEQVIITAGSQQALYLLAQLLLAPGDKVWIESPGYQGAAAPFEAAGARICPVPVDPDGMNVRYASARYPDARLIFVTPSHQLPLGITMSLPRRLDLLSWAASHRAWVIEDDYDSEYRYGGPPLASLQGLDRAGCVIYTGTFSKVLFPDLRLGYIVAPPGLVTPLIRAKAVIDRFSPVLPQAVLADFIAGGHFGRHIRRTRDAYGERRQVLLDAIQARLDGALHCVPAGAGLDMCTHFGLPFPEAEVARRAKAARIDLRTLGYYAHPMAGPDCAAAPGLLLGFSAFSAAQLKAGVDDLAQVFDGLCEPGSRERRME